MCESKRIAEFHCFHDHTSVKGDRGKHQLVKVRREKRAFFGSGFWSMLSIEMDKTPGLQNFIL